MVFKLWGWVKLTREKMYAGEGNEVQDEIPESSNIKKWRKKWGESTEKEWPVRQMENRRM